MDSAVKGTALLVLAAVAAMILRRDSAATRHLVWLLAIVAMLVVPVLSAMLPQWRVLPEWAGIPPETAVAATSPPSIARPADGAACIAAECRARGSRAAIRNCVSTGCRTAGFTARARGTGNHSRVGRSELELDRCTATRVGDWFFRAHPAADGRSNDALEFRTARDGHLVVKATRKSNS